MNTTPQFISSGFIGYLVVPDGLSHELDVNKSYVAGGECHSRNIVISEFVLYENSHQKQIKLLQFKFHSVLTVTVLLAVSKH